MARSNSAAASIKAFVVALAGHSEGEAALISIIKGLHTRTPLWLKNFYMPLVRKNSYYVQRLVNLVYPPVFIFEGEEKNIKSSLNFAYAGFHEQVMLYWAGVILSPGFRKHTQSRQFIWNIRSFLKRNSPQCDLVLMEHNSLSLKCLGQNGFRIPFWVTMELDISEPFEKLFGRQRSDIGRKIRKYGLSYTMTKDISSFDDFYRNMFMPYIQNRHTQTAFLETYEDVRCALSKGELILIKKDGQVLAGGMVEFDEGQVKFRRLGVRDAKWEYVQCGVLGALYYFLTLEMKKRGYTKMHIGGTRPLLSDGVTKFKMSLNARLVSEQNRSCLWMTFLRSSIGLNDFLKHNPFIFINKEKQPCLAVFSTSKEVDQAQASFKCEGLQETPVFVLGNDFIR